MERMVKNFSWGLDVNRPFFQVAGKFSYDTPSSAPLCSTLPDAQQMISSLMCPICSQSFRSSRLSHVIKASLTCQHIFQAQIRSIAEFSVAEQDQVHKFSYQWVGHGNWSHFLSLKPEKYPSPSPQSAKVRKRHYHQCPADERMCKLLHRGRCYLLCINFLASHDYPFTSCHTRLVLTSSMLCTSSFKRTWFPPILGTIVLN